jgi:hypothetical protein
MFTGIAQDRIHQTSLSQSDYNRLSQSINSFRENWIQQLEDGEMEIQFSTFTMETLWLSIVPLSTP